MTSFLKAFPQYWKGVLSAIPFVVAVGQTIADYADSHPGPFVGRDWIAIAVTAFTTVTVIAKRNADKPPKALLVPPVPPPVG